MSEQHEPEVVPVEVDQDHEVVEQGDTVPQEPQDVAAGEEGVTPGEKVPEDEPLDYEAERYARACEDPAYAEVQAIDVADDDKGEAWEGYAPGQPLLVSPVPDEVNDAPPEWDDSDDGSEEV
jgi:hypothetical protein